MINFTPSILGALLALASIVRAKPPDPTNDFCCLSNHMLAVDDDTLYIAGGWMLYSAQNDYGGRNTVLRSLNISKSFRTDLDSVNFIRSEELPDSVPGMSSSAWWPTDGSHNIDLALGRYYMQNTTYFGVKDVPREDRKWTFNTITREWTEKPITLQGWSQTNSSFRVSTKMREWVPKLKKGFYFGGMFVISTPTKSTESYDHDGLITYDAATDVWTNTSTPIGGVAEGGLVHLSTATDEILIQFGGRSESFTAMKSFSEINIYSINQSKWYTHSLGATATVPTPRFTFCTALKSAADGSSHQIYMFGGVEAPSTGGTVRGGPTTSSIWVLTIPTFEWVQLPFKSVSTAADPKGRIAPECMSLGEHYIFYYGGRNAASFYGTLTCDRKANAAFLFDVNNLTWTDQYEPRQGSYHVPKLVYDLIGGDKTGGATRTAPTGGFKDPNLSTIMSFSITTPTSTIVGPKSTNNPGASPSTGSSTGPSSNTESQTNIAAIAGGAGGGVAVVAVLAIGILLIRRRRRRRDLDQQQNAPGYFSDGKTEHQQPVELHTHPDLVDRQTYATELPGHEVAREMHSA